MGLKATSLAELLNSISELDLDSSIFIASEPGVRPETPATLGSARAAAPPGYRYLLEVEVAQDVLDVWSAWRKGRNPNTAERVEAVAYYARTDSYLPVGN